MSRGESPSNTPRLDELIKESRTSNRGPRGDPGEDGVQKEISLFVSLH